MSALAAVVAATAAGTAWVHAHVSDEAVLGIAAAFLLGVAWAVMIFTMTRRRFTPKKKIHRLVVLFPMQFVITAVAAAVGGDAAGYIAAYGIVALGAIPIFWDAYRLDKDGHMKCPDCLEVVKCKVRVCRYCHHECFLPSQTDVAASAEARAEPAQRDRPPLSTA